MGASFGVKCWSPDAARSRTPASDLVSEISNLKFEISQTRRDLYVLGNIKCEISAPDFHLKSQISNHGLLRRGLLSGDECARQKSGIVSGKATPVSTVRLCCVPRKTTRQSCSRCVSWLVSNNFCPLRTGTLSSSRAPFAFTFSVYASSWKGSVPGS
jgi:hypothetical protein